MSKKKSTSKKTVKGKGKTSDTGKASGEKIKVSRTRRRLYNVSGKAEPESSEPAKTELRANEIVRKYSLWSSATVVIPIPLIDMAYIIGVQLKMLAALSDLYEIEFKKNRGKAIVSSLISGLASNHFIYSAAPWMIRYIPVVGILAAPFTTVLFSGAVTYAVGKVFIQHFEAGGTFLNFRPEEVKEYFRAEFQKKYNSEKVETESVN